MFGDMLLLLVIYLFVPPSLYVLHRACVCVSLFLCVSISLSPTPTLLHTNMPPII
jgi:hypothetical protein